MKLKEFNKLMDSVRDNLKYISTYEGAVYRGICIAVGVATSSMYPNNSAKEYELDVALKCAIKDFFCNNRVYYWGEPREGIPEQRYLWRVNAVEMMRWTMINFKMYKEL